MRKEDSWLRSNTFNLIRNFGEGVNIQSIEEDKIKMLELETLDYFDSHVLYGYLSSQYGKLSHELSNEFKLEIEESKKQIRESHIINTPYLNLNNSEREYIHLVTALRLSDKNPRINKYFSKLYNAKLILKALSELNKQKDLSSVIEV